MILAAETVATEGAGFWVLLIPSLGTLVAAIAACFYAFAAKMRGDTVAMNLTRDRDLAIQQVEFDRAHARQQAEKLDKIGTQTDGRLSEVIEANRRLQQQLDDVKRTLATLQGREIERKDAETKS